MSYWIFGKNSEGKGTVTTTYIHGRSWLSCIYVSVFYFFVSVLALCYLVPKFLPNLHGIFQFSLIMFGAFCVFWVVLILLRIKGEKPNIMKADEK